MENRPRTWWKLLGAAGLVGVAATGVLVARNERARRSYTPEEIRTRLMEAYVRAEQAEEGRQVRLQADDDAEAPDPPGRARAPWVAAREALGRCAALGRRRRS